MGRDRFDWGFEKRMANLTNGTIVRLNSIEDELRGKTAVVKRRIDEENNRVDLTIQDFVFDSSELNLRMILNLSDMFAIDALNTGEVCIEVTLFDACEEKGQ